MQALAIDFLACFYLFAAQWSPAGGVDPCLTLPRQRAASHDLDGLDHQLLIPISSRTPAIESSSFAWLEALVNQEGESIGSVIWSADSNPVRNALDNSRLVQREFVVDCRCRCPLQHYQLDFCHYRRHDKGCKLR